MPGRRSRTLNSPIDCCSRAAFSAEDDFYVGMDLDKPFVDYVGLSRSLGVPGERVEKAAEVGPAIGRGLASGGPYLIDVRIDPAFK